MLSTAEPTCFLIADISGYTGYLADVELDHAQDIAAQRVTRGTRTAVRDVDLIANELDRARVEHTERGEVEIPVRDDGPRRGVRGRRGRFRGGC